jgi:hypothetical protein
VPVTDRSWQGVTATSQDERARPVPSAAHLTAFEADRKKGDTTNASSELMAVEQGSTSGLLTPSTAREAVPTEASQ